jgi:DNA-binding transcriptional regulator GbsR (MarR family)
LNPLDYSIWSILEAEVNAEVHESVESLRDALEKSSNDLDQSVINNAMDDWMRRLDTVIEAKGGHFE